MAHAATEAVELKQLLAGVPEAPVISAGEVRRAATRSRRLVVLDDDPTGTQTVTDVPIVTAWEEDDLRWALAQATTGFYVLTNTRSLEPDAAAGRTRDVLQRLSRAAADLRVEISVLSRSDSTLRGHYPLETDVISEEYGTRFGNTVDGVLVIPAYVDAGRVTVDSCHWVRTEDGFVPVGSSEFAADPTFGYGASDLRDFVQEKTGSRWRRDQVARITLSDLRIGGVAHVTTRLRSLREGRPLVVDAVCDEDLRVLALAVMDAEASGHTLLCRTGPSYVRSRLGQEAQPPLSDRALAAMMGEASRRTARPRAAGGLVVAGSYVGLTTRQLARLASLNGIVELELDVAELLATENPGTLTAMLATQATNALAHGDVVLRTSRELINPTRGQSSLATQVRVSDALVQIVGEVVERTAPRWTLGKGGVTSSDLATRSLGMRRAWVRGTLLDGIVSVWEPAAGSSVADRAATGPFVVFAGNVGDDGSLLDVVKRLRGAAA